MNFEKIKTKQLRKIAKEQGMTTKGQTRDVIIWRLQQHVQKKKNLGWRGRIRVIRDKQMVALKESLRGESNLPGVMILRLLCECVKSVYDVPVVLVKVSGNQNNKASTVQRDITEKILDSNQFGMSVHTFVAKFGTHTAKHCMAHESPAKGLRALVLQTKLQLYRAVVLRTPLDQTPELAFAAGLVAFFNLNVGLSPVIGKIILSYFNPTIAAMKSSERKHFDSNRRATRTRERKRREKRR